MEKGLQLPLGFCILYGNRKGATGRISICIGYLKRIYRLVPEIHRHREVHGFGVKSSVVHPSILPFHPCAETSSTLHHLNILLSLCLLIGKIHHSLSIPRFLGFHWALWPISSNTSACRPLGLNLGLKIKSIGISLLVNAPCTLPASITSFLGFGISIYIVMATPPPQPDSVVCFRQFLHADVDSATTAGIAVI